MTESTEKTGKETGLAGRFAQAVRGLLGGQETAPPPVTEPESPHAENRFHAIIAGTDKYPYEATKAAAIADLFNAAQGNPQARADVTAEYNAYLEQLQQRRKEFAKEVLAASSSSIPFSATQSLMETVQGLLVPGNKDLSAEDIEKFGEISSLLDKMERTQRESIGTMTRMENENDDLRTIYRTLKTGESMVASPEMIPSGRHVSQTLGHLINDAASISALVDAGEQQLQRIQKLKENFAVQSFNIAKAATARQNRDAFMSDLEGNGVTTRRKVAAPKTARFKKTPQTTL